MDQSGHLRLTTVSDHASRHRHCLPGSMCMMHRSRLKCRWHARGWFCVAVTTALAVTVVMHVAVLMMLVDRQYALRNNQPNANLAPRRLMHHGSAGRNETALKGLPVHSAFAHNYGDGKQFDRSRKFVNIHEAVHYRLPINRIGHVRKIGYIKRRRIHKRGASKQYPNSLGGTIWSLQADITLDELMPVRNVLPPAHRDRDA